MQKTKRKIIIVTSNYFSFRGFILPWCELLKEDFEVTVFGNFGKRIRDLEFQFKSINFENIRIKRKPSPVSDLLCVLTLWVKFMKLRPDIVYTMMPKPGLLGQLAAIASFTDIRLHIFTGQHWQRLGRAQKFIYIKVDRLIAVCANRLATDSEYQRTALEKYKIVRTSKEVRLFHRGSICGAVFCEYQNKYKCLTKPIIRERPLKILFMARVTKDKGFFDFCTALRKLKKMGFAYEAIVCGPDEESIIETYFANTNLFKYVEYSDNVEKYFHWSDLICLPSYREGLPMTLLQAISYGVIPITSSLQGCMEIIYNDANLSFTPGDYDKLVASFIDFSGFSSEELSKISLDNYKYVEQKYELNKVYQGFKTVLD